MKPCKANPLATLLVRAAHEAGREREREKRKRQNEKDAKERHRIRFLPFAPLFLRCSPLAQASFHGSLTFPLVRYLLPSPPSLSLLRGVAPLPPPIHARLPCSALHVGFREHVR
ncbi:hypothetical protein GW17_00050814 [Ensete ventricosum]|nr:hypothetical protein GW17_00050814 [Ensete ventricosum]